MRIEILCEVKKGVFSLPSPRMEDESEDEFASRYEGTKEWIHLSAQITVHQAGVPDKGATIRSTRFPEAELATVQKSFMFELLGKHAPEWKEGGK